MTLRSTRAPLATLALCSAFASTLALAACGASNESSSSSSGGSGSSSSAKQLTGTLNGAGSSAQQAAIQGWQAGFTKVQPNVTVNYSPIGSGDGRTQFLTGAVDFAGSDAALTDDELKKAADRCGDAGVYEIPAYISAIAVVYHLDGVKDLNLSPDNVAKIFAGSITTWNDPAIAKDNPDAKLPSTTITPVHRSDKSGTTKNFTDYLAKTAASSWTGGAVDTWPVQGGEGANQTSGLVQAVQAGNGTIGYADESQAQKLGIAKIKVGDSFVAPSAEGAAAVVENSEVVSGRGDYDFAYSINRTTTDKSEYPLVLVSYHIGCVQNADATQADLLQAFEGYVISSEGQDAAKEQAGSSPLSDKLREQAQQAVDAISAKK